MRGLARPSTTGCAARLLEGNLSMNKVEKISRPLPPELLARFAEIVSSRNALTDPNDIAPYLIEDRDLYPGRSPLVLRPGATAEVSAIVKLANETKTAIVPQGGNTG